MSELKQNTLLGALHSKKAHQMEEAVTQLNLKLQALEMAWDDSTHQDGLYGAFTLMEMVITQQCLRDNYWY